MTDYTVGDTLFIAFTTRSFSTGAPTQLAGTPAVSAYENADLTQITAGITLGVDHDIVTGLNMLTVVATGANGYEAGKDYHLVITTGTVGGVSVVGEVVGRFTLGRSAAAVDLANATDGLGALKTVVDAILVDTGTTLDDLVDDLETRLGIPSNLGSGASIAANLVDIEAQTDDIGAAGAGLTAVPDLAGVTTLLARATEARLAELDAANLPTDVANVQTEVDKLDAAQTEPTGVPAAAATPLTKLAILYMMARNKVTVTSAKKTFFGDDDIAEFEKDLSDDGTTYTETEVNVI